MYKRGTKGLLIPFKFSLAISKSEEKTQYCFAMIISKKFFFPRVFFVPFSTEVPITLKNISDLKCLSLFNCLFSRNHIFENILKFIIIIFNNNFQVSCTRGFTFDVDLITNDQCNLQFAYFLSQRTISDLYLIVYLVEFV